MKRLIYVALGALMLTFTLNSCDIADTNIDPTRLNDTQLNLILPTAISQSAYNQSSNPARVAGIIMQQFLGRDAQQEQYNRYVIDRNTFDNYWNTGLYVGALKDCAIMIEKAAAEGQPHYEGMAKILMAYNYGMATSYFGDIPFTEALKGLDDLKPAYDKQSDVYAGVQQLLDQAISALSMDPVTGGPFDAGGDLIYWNASNTAEEQADYWIGVAHALKARFYMHVSKQDASAYASALSEVGKAFSSLADQPGFTFDAAESAANPMAQFGIQRPNTMGVDTIFAQKMTAAADPRQSYYMVADGDGYTFYSGSNAKLAWAQNASTIPLISFVELEFIRAEALQRTGAGASEVKAALESAITASMDQLGIDPADYATYVADHSDLSGMNGDAIIEHIITEAYYAYFGFAFSESWTNYRRTGYPALTPNPGGANGLNPSGGIPKRFPLTETEEATNADNFDAALAAQSGGLMDVATWANK